MALPTNRNTGSTAAEHVADHNALHAAYNGSERIIRVVTLDNPASQLDTGVLPTLDDAWLLRAVYNVRHASDSAVNLRGRFNYDSSSNYSHTEVVAFNNSVVGGMLSGVTSFRLEGVGNDGSDRWTIGEILVPDYRSTNKSKSGIVRTFRPGNLGTTMTVMYGGFHWAPAATAISSIQIFPQSGNLAAGSQIVVFATPLPPQS